MDTLFIRTQIDDCCDIIYPVCLVCGSVVVAQMPGKANVVLQATINNMGILELLD